MRPLVLATTLAVSLTSYAQSVEVKGPTGVDLNSGALTPLEGAELRLLPMRIEAPGGVRLEESEQTFSFSAPVVIGRSFIVKNLEGEEYRFWIHAMAGEHRWIEVQKVGSEHGGLAALGGVFKATTFSIDGVPANSTQRDLRILTDGTYSIGSVRGKWKADRQYLTLDGQYQEWGQGLIGREGSTVTFRFTRSGMQFEVVMTRAAMAEAGAEVRSSSRAGSSQP